MSMENGLFEKEPVTKAILKQAMPSVLGQIILVIYNMADTFFVALTGNDSMITAVTICMPAFMFLSAIANLFGIGGASVISRSLGMEDEQRAENTSAFSVWMCLIVTAVYLLGALVFRHSFVDFLGGTDPAVHTMACRYLIITVVLGGELTAMSNLVAHLLRSVGFSMKAGIGIALGGILNIVLDPLFMFVILPEGNEVMGAALATTLSNAAAFVYFAVLMAQKRNREVIFIKPSAGMFGSQIPKEVLSAGLPACLMTLFENLSFAVLNRLMDNVCTAAQAGIGVAKKINMLAHSLVRGMAQGVLPLLGYSFAAKNYRRMKKILRQTILISVSLACICTFVCFFFNQELTELFIRYDGPSKEYGEAFLKLLCIGAPFSACAYTMITFFQATGKGMRATLLALTRKGFLDIPLMFFLAKVWVDFGPVAATPITDVVCCVLAVILYGGFTRHLYRGTVR